MLKPGRWFGILPCAVAFLLLLPASRMALADEGGAGKSDKGKEGERYLTLSLMPAKTQTGEMLVVVDTQLHTIVVYAYNKNHEIVPVAVRNYTYDLLIKEYPVPELAKKWTKGFSSWDARKHFEDFKKVEIKEKEKKKASEITEEEIRPPIGSGQGKTLLLELNAINTQQNPQEHIMIIDEGSHLEHAGDLTILAYAIDENGLTPKAIRSITQDFRLAGYKYKTGENSFNGDFKNPKAEIDEFHVEKIEEFLKKQAEKEKKEKENKQKGKEAE